jgi:hypothetical protein
MMLVTGSVSLLGLGLLVTQAVSRDVARSDDDSTVRMIEFVALGVGRAAACRLPICASKPRGS